MTLTGHVSQRLFYLRAQDICDSCKQLLVLEIKAFIVNLRTIIQERAFPCTFEFDLPIGTVQVPPLRKCCACRRPALKNLIDLVTAEVSSSTFVELCQGLQHINFKKLSADKNVLFLLDFSTEFLVKHNQRSTTTYQDAGVQVDGNGQSQYRRAIKEISQLFQLSFVTPDALLDHLRSLKASHDDMVSKDYEAQLATIRQQNNQLDKDLTLYIQQYNRIKTLSQQGISFRESDEVSFLKKSLQARDDQCKVLETTVGLEDRKIFLQSIVRKAKVPCPGRKSAELQRFTKMHTGRLHVQTNEVKLQLANDRIEALQDQVVSLNEYIEDMQTSSQQMQTQQTHLRDIIEEQRDVEEQNQYYGEIIQTLIAEICSLHGSLATTRISPGFAPNFAPDLETYVHNTDTLLVHSNYSNGELLAYQAALYDAVAASTFVGGFGPTGSSDSANFQSIQSYYTRSSELYVRHLLSGFQTLVLLPAEAISLQWEFAYSGGEQFLVCLAVLLIWGRRLVERNGVLVVSKCD
ncbi:hypothetical protein SS50377_26438 [Spironucleus salmonicida]|uniref:Uncharacterized protein n=1 Tax=Spironucleus salmonicida TaxID=348837 RepID=V6LAQ2_9EUKA|nr:hypothetical protein SS50377_26438 [Spironucleus salmonicida]|eukprot:EST41298.1 Hypothetical protein SS50377_19011 [Spironucleus salmonicida]